MDGGIKPPSFDLLCLTVPGEITTAINDGHVTAALVYGEDRRDDVRAGQQFFIREVLEILQAQDFIGGDDSGYRWLKSLDGTWDVNVDGSSYRIFGQLERRLSADRHMLGETNELGKASGPMGYFTSGSVQPLEVEVMGPRGGKEIKKFQVHPLALAIPPMTEPEREQLRESILRNGVKQPLIIFDGKVLDGRHRFYFASILKKPVRIEEFIGTEEEAKRQVAILNLHRRHLTTAQRYLVADNLFGAQAEREATMAVGGRPKKSEKPPPKMAGVSGHDRSGESHERAAKLATDAGISGIKPKGMRSIKEVRGAPQTRARVESGEIQTVVKAVAEARKEKQLPPSTSSATIDTISVNRRLGRMITEGQAILKDLNDDAPIGAIFEISGKLDQIEMLVPKIRSALRRLNILR
jgi:hypothetical protein